MWQLSTHIPFEILKDWEPPHFRQVIRVGSSLQGQKLQRN